MSAFFLLPNISGGGLIVMGAPNSYTPPFWTGNDPNRYNFQSGGQDLGYAPLYFNAHNSNAIYTDNGKVLPLSISKQSYIIYK